MFFVFNAPFSLKNDGIQDAHPVLIVLKGDVTWDDLEQQFLVQYMQRFNIIATLIRIAAALFQHCNTVFCKKLLLKIVPCTIDHLKAFLQLVVNKRENWTLD